MAATRPTHRALDDFTLRALAAAQAAGGEDHISLIIRTSIGSATVPLPVPGSSVESEQLALSEVPRRMIEMGATAAALIVPSPRPPEASAKDEVLVLIAGPQLGPIETFSATVCRPRGEPPAVGRFARHPGDPMGLWVRGMNYGLWASEEGFHELPCPEFDSSVLADLD